MNLKLTRTQALVLQACLGILHVSAVEFPGLAQEWVKYLTHVHSALAVGIQAIAAAFHPGDPPISINPTAPDNKP